MSKTKLLKLQRLPIRVFTRTQLNKKSKRAVITLCLEYQRVIIRLVKLKLKKVGKRITKRKTKRKKLSPGVHLVTINKKKRKVKVNSKGQWRFMKGRGR
jgi:hypothetical protein